MCSKKDVDVSLDAIDAAQIDAEARARGISRDDVMREKFDAGVRRMFPIFSAPDRPSRGRFRH